MHERICATPGCGRLARSPSAKVCTTCHDRKLRDVPLLAEVVACRQCGESFLPKRLGMCYCSPECSYRYRKTLEARRIKERLALTRITHCLKCGVDITHRTNKAKCCSKACYDLWHKVENHEQIASKRRAKYHADVEASRERSRRYRAENPEQRALTSIAYRLKNADKIRESGKRGRKLQDPDGVKNRLRFQNRRARLLGNPGSVGVSPHDWYRMVRIYGHCCAYCGQRSDKLTLDHVIPVAKGGRHAIGNAVPACGRCNSSKSDKFLAVWRYKYLPLVRRAAA